MWIVVVTLVVLGVLVAVLKSLGIGAGEEPKAGTGHSCATCSGAGADGSGCVNECLLRNLTAEPVYFDDEELDAYRGRSSSSYTEKEVEEFAEVMHTMRPEEVKEWLKSLTSRGIHLPDSLKDEAIMLARG